MKPLFQNLGNLSTTDVVDLTFKYPIFTDIGWCLTSVAKLKELVTVDLDTRVSTLETSGSASIWPAAIDFSLGGVASGNVLMDGSTNVVLTVAINDGSLSVATISGLGVTLLGLQTDVTSLQDSINSLTLSDVSIQSQIDTLTQADASFQITITGLQDSINTLVLSDTDLQNSITALQNADVTLGQTDTLLQSQIDQLVIDVGNAGLPDWVFVNTSSNISPSIPTAMDSTNPLIASIAAPLEIGKTYTIKALGSNDHLIDPLTNTITFKKIPIGGDGKITMLDGDVVELLVWDIDKLEII